MLWLTRILNTKKKKSFCRKVVEMPMDFYIAVLMQQKRESFFEFISFVVYTQVISGANLGARDRTLSHAFHLSHSTVISFA